MRKKIFISLLGLIIKLELDQMNFLNVLPNKMPFLSLQEMEFKFIRLTPSLPQTKTQKPG
jgi:hypothetical protein